jgi:hypothetical protein
MRPAESFSAIAKESAVFANVTSLTVNPMFLHHDLLIELGRLEMAIGDMRSNVPANDRPDFDVLDLGVLESAQSTIRQTLDRIPT